MSHPDSQPDPTCSGRSSARQSSPWLSAEGIGAEMSQVQILSPRPTPFLTTSHYIPLS